MILQVGKVIRSLLIEDPEVSKLVNKLVYPLVADADTKFPFIVYRRSGISQLTSKDRFISRSDADIEIVIASLTYENSIKIASKVKDILLHKRGNIAGIDVVNIELINASEDYIEETFIQSLTFKIIINK